MIRLIIAIACLLLLAGCASTTHYHPADVAGSDYYYADSDGYYDRTGSSWARHCSDGNRYGRYSYSDCQATGRYGAGPYGYGAWAGPWAGWGYPYSYSGTPYLAYGGGWGGSFWFGLGGVSSWGYPGYYNPWYGPMWPYSVSYPGQRHPYRDRQRLHREQGLQAGWQRHPRRGGSAAGYAASHGQSRGVTRQTRALRRQETLRHHSESARQNRKQGLPPRAPAATNTTNSLPRGRPAQGIPVNWPTNRQPTRSNTVSRRPISRPQDRPTPRPSRTSDARLSHSEVRSVPLPTRSAPTPRARPQSRMVPRSQTFTRPGSRSVPSPQPTTRTRSAPTPRASSGVSSSRSHSSSSAAPRGRPTRKDRD